MKDSRKLSAKAIFIGSLVDIGGTFVASLLYAIIMGILLGLQGVPRADIEVKLTQGTAVYLSSLIIGFIFTFSGGYAAGRIAKTSEVLNAGMVGIINVLIGLALYKPLNMASYPQWYTIIGFALAIPSALLGGHAAIAKKQG